MSTISKPSYSRCNIKPPSNAIIDQTRIQIKKGYTEAPQNTSSMNPRLEDIPENWHGETLNTKNSTPSSHGFGIAKNMHNRNNNQIIMIITLLNNKPNGVKKPKKLNKQIPQ